MNEYDLFDAFGGIDDELLNRSEHRAVRKFPIRKALIAAAAVMLLAVTAVASPAVREFISAKGSELISGDLYITLEKLGLVDFYVPPNYEIELESPADPDVPEYIQEFRVPTYFVENGWTMDHVEVSSETEPDCASVLFFEPNNPVPQVFFQQHVFYPSADPELLHMCFSISGVGDKGLTEETITIDGREATLYNGEFIIWTDGQYAYELYCYHDPEPSEFEDAVLSLKPVDLWKEDYLLLEATLVEMPKQPIETFYTLGKVPEGFVLTDRTWDVNETWEHYCLDFYHNISFKQCVNPSDDRYDPGFTIADTLLDMTIDQRDFTAEDYMVDGVEVTIFREEGEMLKLMWHLDEYCFSLSFSYDPGLTDEELLDFYRSVQPMPDFTDHLTE